MPSEYGQFIKLYKTKEEEEAYNDGVEASFQLLEFALDKSGYKISGMEQLKTNSIIKVRE